MTARQSIASLEADGHWCPMAHCNRQGDSFHDLPVLRELKTVERLANGLGASYALNNLGSFTGEAMAVCVYESPRHPALVAYDYQDGSVRWTSPLEDLQSGGRRSPDGILLARMRFAGGNVQRCVFAVNPREFVAYSADGRLLWKRATAEIAGGGRHWVGAPRSLKFSDANELVTATTEGWVIKLDPVDGRVIDAYEMDTSVVVGDRMYQGTFICIKAPVVVGNNLYLAVRFRPHPHNPLARPLHPVYVVRIDLCRPGARGPGTSIAPLSRPLHRWDPTPDRVAIGVSRAGGSPSAWVEPDGTVLVLANAQAMVHGGRYPTVVAVEDRKGSLRTRWHCILDRTPGDDINAAPAFHAGSRMLLVPLGSGISIFRDVDRLKGTVQSPTLQHSWTLLDLAGRRWQWARTSSPVALTFDQEAGELVAYTNFRLGSALYRATYGFLGAFAIPVEHRGAPRPLWSHPLGLGFAGMSIPGPGTFGQPALFRYANGPGQATGLIVNTVFTGTYMLK